MSAMDAEDRPSETSAEHADLPKERRIDDDLPGWMKNIAPSIGLLDSEYLRSVGLAQRRSWDKPHIRLKNDDTLEGNGRAPFEG